MHQRKVILILSLFLNYFVFAILLNSVGAVILQVQSSFSVTASEASVLEAYKDLSIALASFLVAAFISRAGYKRSMLVALIFVFLALLAMPQFPSMWMNKFLFMVTGVSFAVVKVSIFATLGILTSNQREHASLMSFLEAFFMVGVLSGYFLFSAFVDDSDILSLDWYNVYYPLAALVALAILTLSTAPLNEEKPDAQPQTSLLESFWGMLALCARPLVLVFVLSIFLYVLIEQGIMSWLPTFNNTVLGLPASLSIQMTSILAASIAIGRFLAGYMAKRVNWYPLLCSCLAVSGILVLSALPLAENLASTAAVTGWSNAPSAAFVFPLIGLCLAPVYPIINSVILSALPQWQHAPMTGLIVVFSALGGTVGSIITGALFEALGGTTAFYFSLVPLFGIFITLFFLKKYTESSKTDHGLSQGETRNV
jgi:fucose permease